MPGGRLIRPAPLAQLLRELQLAGPVRAEPSRARARGLYPASPRGMRWRKGGCPQLGSQGWPGDSPLPRGTGLGDLSAALGTVVPFWGRGPGETPRPRGAGKVAGAGSSSGSPSGGFSQMCQGIRAKVFSLPRTSRAASPASTKACGNSAGKQRPP